MNNNQKAPPRKERFVVNGLPFTVTTDNRVASRDEVFNAFLARLQSDEGAAIFKHRQDQLGLSDEVVAANRDLTSGMKASNSKAFDKSYTSTEEVLIGAGRTLMKKWRGAQQIQNDREMELAERIMTKAPQTKMGQKYMKQLQEERAQIDKVVRQDRNLFRRLDDEGIGMEDLGEVLPELAAFIGTGGWISATLRGGAMGGLEPVVGPESRGTNAAAGALATATGVGGARAIAGLSKAGLGKLGAGMTAVANRFSKQPGGVPKAVAGVAEDSVQAMNVRGELMKELGTKAYERISPLVQALNATGKKNATVSAANSALQKSLKQVEGRNVVDMGTFAQKMAHLSESQFSKDVGPVFGKLLNNMRVTADQLAKLGSVSPSQAEAILRATAGDKAVQQLQKALVGEVKKGASERTLGTLAKAIYNRSVQYTKELAQQTVGVIGEASGGMAKGLPAALEDDVEAYIGVGMQRPREQ